MLRMGRVAFPGLVVRDPGLDLIVKGLLRACLMETIQDFKSGKGKSSYLEDIWRELRQFDLITVTRDPRYIPRPSVTVYTVGIPGDMIKLVNLTKIEEKGAPIVGVNGAVQIKIQTRALVSPNF